MNVYKDIVDAYVDYDLIAEAHVIGMGYREFISCILKSSDRFNFLSGYKGKFTLWWTDKLIRG